jgi:hypothetical protein
MTASRLDDLSVNDFDDAVEHEDYTVDIRSGGIGLDHALAYTSPEHPRLARGTEPQLANAVAHAIEHGHAEVLREDGSVRMVISIPPAKPDPHLDCHAVLHEALTTLLALEALVTRCGGFMRMDDQAVLFAARELLRRHGRR